MSGYNFYRRQRKRDQDQYGGQNTGGGNYSQNYQNMGQSMGNMGSQMMNPWQSGMMPALSAGSDEAALAFNILNQVLATDSPMGGGGQGQGDGFHNRKSRQMNIGDRLEDRRRGRSPQYSNRNRSDQGSRQWSGGRSRSPQRRNDYSNSSRRDDSDRKKPAKERLGNRQGGGQSSNAKRNQNKEQTPSDKRRKSSDKERDRQSSEKPSSRGTSASRDKDDLEDKDADEVKTDKKRKADPEYDAYISKCLKCHICEIDSFENLESFRDHKKSEDHTLLANIFHERSEAALQLMRADSKLAANREREKSGVANKESFYTRCVKCHCIVADAFKTHSKSIEHELVDSYMFRECCGSSFNERKKYDEHRVTIPHLKRDMEVKKEEESPDDKIVLAFTDEERAAGDILYQFKQSHRFELESPADFPDYDAETPTGLGYVHKKRRYKCNVCKKSFPSYSNMALAHCRSFNHYLMLLAHLETKLPDVEDDEIFESDEKNEDDNEAKKSDQEMEVDADANADADADEDKPESKNKDEEEEETKVTDEVEEEDKENDNENADGDEDMGEHLPPLEDGGIILEDVDKAADDDAEEEEETELEADEVLVEEEAKEIERMSNDEESTPAPEEEEEEKNTEEPEVEMETSEKVKDEETQDEVTQEEVTQEEAKDEEEEEEEEEKVKPVRRQRARRGRGRSALRF